MEKVIIKPVTKEILIKGGNKEGSSDLFSYDYDSDQHKRKLGHLYVVGNIQSGAETGGEELDIAYVTNLVASLAKREYYSKPNLSAKEAFSASLKKINGVVEEFFKKQDTKINVGIFTVAGDEIHISKIGKFKIILSRDGKNIDILNNVDLFNKEKTQEKEFSNIISGKIREGDKILAFYPSRAVTSREKYIKDHFSKSPVGDFEAKLASIKETKPDFACAALHLEIQKTTESAEVPKIEPKELAQAAVAEAETESEPKVAEKP